jgi:hypothetical protein
MSARLRRIVAGSLAVAVVVNLGVAGAVVGHHLATASDGARVKSPQSHFRALPDQPAPTAESLRSHAVAALLAERADAIRRHDRHAFLASVDPRSRPFRAQQASYFANLQRVPFASWTYQLDATNAAPTDGSQFLRYQAQVWLPHVVLHYAIRGFDRAPTALDMYYTFVHRGAHWYIGGDADSAKLGYESARDIWDFGPVTITTGHRVIVLGHPKSHVSLRALADEADRDIPRVTSVWGSGWSQRVVVLAPNSATELSKVLADNDDLSQIAAVATAELVEGSQRTTPVGDRVLVNPNNYEKLNAKGRQVVMTHEITHVASRVASGPLLPDWLIEGIADYVGYRDLHVPPTTAAHALKVYLDGGHHLSGLPSDDVYVGSNKHLDLAYDESWLACRFIAEHWGQSTLVQLYRKLGTTTRGTNTTATDASMRAVLHVSLATFTRQWHSYVATVL